MVFIKLETINMEAYLRRTKYINYDHPHILALAQELAMKCSTKTDLIKIMYEYVRDEISHSWDIQAREISITASDVLHIGHGICYAKSNLLAALLRSQDIPTGFCYQRLTLGDTPDTGYVIHALNAVYIKELDQWIRLDARGNKEGVNAQFSLEEEQLAFPVRPEYEEINYDTIYSDPAEVTMRTLEDNTDCIEMYMKGLPTHI